ncbi:MAG: hypothetical protein EON88_09450 [Brevundimonas sp.]|nr:MAG: hypothetical protein EON88_09450 [Brevundimonas sp.]
MAADSAATVPVVADDRMTARGALKVVGFRPDGLGIRLQCLLEAMHLSDLLGAGFAVVWPDPVEGVEHHAVRPAIETFTQAYCDAHVVERPDAGAYAEVPPSITDLSDLAAVADGTGGWMVRRANVLGNLPEALRKPAGGGFRRLFDSIQFQPHLSAAIAQADDVPLPETPVALHLRAGDIIYGKHRFGARFTRKVISLPIARQLIERLKEQGRSVVLFSQDPAVARLFREEYGVIVAADTAPQGDPVAQALFEIALMARCGEIYAGNSVFAQIAALIGESALIDPEAVFDRARQAKLIEFDLFRHRRQKAYPALHTAFAAWSGAEPQFRRAPERAIRLVEVALKYDPDNVCYVLKLASLLCRTSRVAEANALIDAELADRADGRQMRLRALGLLHRAGLVGAGSVLVRDRKVLERAAETDGGAIAQLMQDVRALEGRIRRRDHERERPRP